MINYINCVIRLDLNCKFGLGTGQKGRVNGGKIEIKREDKISVLDLIKIKSIFAQN